MIEKENKSNSSSVDDSNKILKNEYQDELSTEDCVDDALTKYIEQAQELWNDSCTSIRKK